MPINIIAADDHRIFLEGLISLFQLTDEFELVAICEDGDSALSLIKTHKPDVALLDISMPGVGTEAIVEYVESNYPDTALIALTMHLEPQLAEELFRLGLSAYVLKEEAFDQLSNAIYAVVKGDQFISPALVKAINKYKTYLDDNDQLLTIREIEVLENAAKGQTNKAIARTLDISERTVRFHVSNSCIKLEAQGRSNAIAKAMSLELINI